MKYILGIDVGTSSVKAVLFDEGGREVYSAGRASHTIRQGNTAEQDMLAVWENVKSCIRSVAEEAADVRGDIVGIGITGQGEGCWLVDQNGQPLRNAILWCDGRAAEEVAAITRDAPEIARLYHETVGCTPLSGSAMMLLKWMSIHQPEILDRAFRMFNCKDWIRYRLTGVMAGEISDAFMSLIDAETDTVAEKLLEALGLSRYRRLIADPLPSDAVAGALTAEAAGELGLPAELPVIAGAVDTSATALGLGAVRAGDACVILGTTCASEIILTKEGCRFGEGNSRYEKHAVPGLYMNLQPTMNGTPNIDWALRTIARTEDYRQVDDILRRVPVGSGGVIYHPYIGSSGERAPFYHPYACASFMGLCQSTTGDALVRAVYEGLCLAIRDCLGDVSGGGTLYLAGGGAKSEVWPQILADAVGMTVAIPDGKEIGARGVALIAGVALGLYADYEEAVEKTRSYSRVYLPDPVRAGQYDLLYGLYREMRMQYTSIWDRRRAVMEAVAAAEQ